MTLAEQLDQAKRRQEIADLDAGDGRVAAEFAQRISLPPMELSADIRTLLDPFNKERHARRCPAKSSTVALFALHLADMGVEIEQILAQLNAIEQMHDKFSLPNPVRTAAVRYAMETIVGADPPRSWPKKDKAAFAMLPSDIRLILAKRQEQMDTEIRRLQSKVARELELRRMNGAEQSVQSNEDKELRHDITQNQG